jgi:hypothetical protein
MMINIAGDESRSTYPVVTTRSSGTVDAPQRVLQDERLAPFATAPSRQALMLLQSRQCNWDGYGSSAPRPEAIGQALVALPALFNAAAKSGLSWLNPHVSANEDGIVVLEWWLLGKKLTVYVSQQETAYIKVWGDDIDNDMEDGVLQSVPADFVDLWTWINA